MSDEPPQISILDARLAEIDRRLSTIQTGLVPDLSGTRSTPPTSLRLAATAELPQRVEVPEPEEPEPPSHATPQAAGLAASPARGLAGSPAAGLAELGAELRRIAAVQERLLASTSELVSAYELVLARLSCAEAAPALQQFSVSAGPFPSTEALRRFEQTLSQIPEVREVSVRGYEGGDRAIVDVQMFGPTP